MHVHCLHWLMSTGLLFQSTFCSPCKSMTGKWYQRRPPIWLWGFDMASTVSACLLGLVVEYWPFVGACTHHSYSKFHYLCLLVSLFKLLPPSTPLLCLSRPPPYIHWPNINEFYEKNCQPLAKTNYLLARLVA